MRTRSLFLFDTSAWIQALTAGRAPSRISERVRELAVAGMGATAGMIRLELLAALSDASAYQRRFDLLDGLNQLPTPESRWREAALLGSQLRGIGVTVPNTDLLIAAVAMAEGATVLHRDRHFDLIAQHAPLLVESYVSPPAS